MRYCANALLLRYDLRGRVQEVAKTERIVEMLHEAVEPFQELQAVRAKKLKVIEAEKEAELVAFREKEAARKASKGQSWRLGMMTRPDTAAIPQTDEVETPETSGNEDSGTDTCVVGDDQLKSGPREESISDVADAAPKSPGRTASRLHDSSKRALNALTMPSAPSDDGPVAGQLGPDAVIARRGVVKESFDGPGALHSDVPVDHLSADRRRRLERLRRKKGVPARRKPTAAAPLRLDVSAAEERLREAVAALSAQIELREKLFADLAKAQIDVRRLRAALENAKEAKELAADQAAREKADIERVLTLARDQVSTLSRGNLNEVMSLRAPPAIVQTTMEAVAMLLTCSPRFLAPSGTKHSRAASHAASLRNLLRASAGLTKGTGRRSSIADAARSGKSGKGSLRTAHSSHTLGLSATVQNNQNTSSTRKKLARPQSAAMLRKLVGASGETTSTVGARMPRSSTAVTGADKRNWEALRHVSRSSDMIAQVLEFQPKWLARDKGVLRVLRERTSKLSPDAAQYASKAAGPLCTWVITQVKFADMLLKHRPAAAEDTECASPSSQQTTLDAHVISLQRQLDEAVRLAEIRGETCARPGADCRSLAAQVRERFESLRAVRLRHRLDPGLEPPILANATLGEMLAESHTKPGTRSISAKPRSTANTMLHVDGETPPHQLSPVGFDAPTTASASEPTSSGTAEAAGTDVAVAAPKSPAAVPSSHVSQVLEFSGRSTTSGDDPREQVRGAGRFTKPAVGRSRDAFTPNEAKLMEDDRMHGRSNSHGISRSKLHGTNRRFGVEEHKEPDVKEVSPASTAGRRKGIHEPAERLRDSKRGAPHGPLNISQHRTVSWTDKNVEISPSTEGSEDSPRPAPIADRVARSIPGWRGQDEPRRAARKAGAQASSKGRLHVDSLSSLGISFGIASPEL